MTAPISSLVPVDPQALVDSLLYSVSHDLRSPLLTMSLSADLLEEALRKQGALGQGDATSVALDALRHGAKDLERMLQALTQISRARRRPLEPARAALRLILGGHVVVSQEMDLERRMVSVDPLVVRDLLDAAGGDQPCEVYVHIRDGYAVLSLTHPLAADAPSPLGVLVASLQQGAGAVVERLAVCQVGIERHGGGVRNADGRLTVWLPLAEGAA